MYGQTSERAIVLASGGLDSTVAAAVARRDGYTLSLLTIDYHQRHAVEIQRAKQVAEALGAERHVVIHVDLRAIGGSALTDELPVPKDRSGSERYQDVPLTYVPSRNLIFLSLAAAQAEVLDASAIYFGANVVDYSGYPDCRPEFIQAVEAVLRVGTKAGMTGKRIEIRAPLLHSTKADIIRLGLTLNVPFHLTHSCYDPIGTVACGHCDSCLIRRRGFIEVGVVDPIQYAVC
ncbi:MAG: 7-cyano-7-deazaguanine synthase QueC [Nitrospira sp.]|nr:7-cyano-7-deazaguanine synthase QueC [Nitrospira sp.]MDH4369375.1 7-cyano-7-deazaguanine synthase QueC [Nitrospira sp.]MDH5498095.1 7-cyano-7-deazaguanine synthase QueC [Nitrospira sp.]